MTGWHNESGRPLASDEWLEAHHQAKLPERKAFAHLICKRSPTRIVDLGCGTGLWLDLLAEKLDPQCELVGVDTDRYNLDKASERLSRWPHKKKFELFDIDEGADKLPEADVFLAFNIFPYIKNLQGLLASIRSKLRPGGCLIVRQYDGALLRMGPMESRDRQLIDISLMTSIMGSSQFKHYDLDRVFETLTRSDFPECSIDFEVFRRVSPYPPEFKKYFLNTVEWTRKYVSDDAGERLKYWIEPRSDGVSEKHPSYFVEVDLVAWLS